MEHCIFPVLNDYQPENHQHPTTKPRKYKEVDLCSSVLQSAATFTTENNIQFTLFVAAVWSIVLARYAETENIRLGFRELQALEDESQKTHIGCKDHMEMKILTLNRGSPVNQLFHSERWSQSGSNNRSNLMSFNTGIVLDAREPSQRVEIYPVHDQVNTFLTFGGSRLHYCIQDCEILIQVSAIHKSHPKGQILYKSSVLSDLHAENLANTITKVMSSIIQNPGQMITHIDLASSQHVDQIRRWNQICDIVADPLILDVIHQQAVSHPNAPAIHSWDGDLTYAELDNLSSRLAAHLRMSLHVKEEMMIPILFEKSVWAIVAMLGVVKAGATVVPLDPQHPVTRLEDILNEVQANLILTSVQYADHLPSAKTKLTVMTCGPDSISLLTSSLTLRHEIKPDFGAYCIFTSGSTGRPKGCVHDHRSLTTSIAASKALHLDRKCRVLQFTSFSFIRSIHEIFCTLSAGATLCVPSDHDRVNNLSEVMCRMKVNWAHLTPTILDSISPETVPDLKILLLGGEVMRPSQIQTWSGRTHLIQTFGMTESGGPVSFKDNVDQLTDHRNIGHSFRGNRWLVEPTNHQKLAPIGAVAELVLEGENLARGYLNLPDETAAAFVSAPVTWHPGDGSVSTEIDNIKLYKTGDLVRYRSDGSLIYVGRKDTMVKIRGQKVEVGEVEHTIMKYLPRATKVVVDAITPLDKRDENILVAFILPPCPPTKDNVNGNMIQGLFNAADEEFLSTVAMVTSELHDILPSYMIPALFISLVNLPVTVTGKVNRRELKASASSLKREQLEALTSPKMTRDHIPPITDIERMVQQLVASMLEKNPQTVGMDQSFIRLGGDSISAMRLVGLMRRAGLTVTVADIMGHPKLSDLASIAVPFAERNSQSTSKAVVEPLSNFHPEQRESILKAAAVQCGVEQDMIEDMYGCTPLQEGLLALSEKRSSMSVARFIYRLQDSIDLVRFKSAWEVVFRANMILRARFVFVHQAKQLFQAVVRSEVQWREATDLATYKLEDDETPMRVGGCPLLRVAMVHEEGNRFFVLTIHHALFDQWSLRSILSQLEKVYDDRSNVLETKSFRPFVEYIENATGLVEHWRAEFDNLNAEVFPSLPYPKYEPKANTDINYHVKLSSHVHGDYTLSNVIRLAWGLVVGRYTDNDDVVFGITVSGRGAPVAEVENMTGPTLATLPLRLKLNPKARVHDVLSAIQNQAAKMISFEQIGIQNIQKCSPEAHLACQFQSHLVVQPALTAVAARLTTCEDGPAVFGGFSNYALVLVCTLAADGLGVTINATVDSNVVKKEQAQHLIELLGHTLAQIVSDPNQKISDLSMLGPRDSKKLKEWNSTPPSRCDECVHDIISKTCSEQLDMVAVCAWDGDLTYKELEIWSSTLATQLIKKSIGPENFVPLMFEKSKWTVVAMLGVIKAGAAFVLLDPSYPLGRLQTICNDVRCHLMLSSAKYVGLCNELGFETLLVNDTDIQWDNIEEERYQSHAAGPQNALYAVFTSGSTGQPKGVVIEHRSYSSAVQNYKRAFRLDQSIRVLQFSSYAFDASIIEMLTTLMVGGCVCIPSESQRRDALPASIHALKVNHAFLTPSVARLLVDQNVADDLKTLVLVGEPMSSKDVDYWGEKVSLINGYGPAECSIASCINPDVKLGTDPTNIGLGSNAGTVCWVVDRHDSHKLVPVGAVGELVVEGPSVGRGYMNDIAKTKKAFIESPRWMSQVRPNSTDSKMYKTGDLVRHEIDGSLCYIGRKDSQVKLRGQRLELGEVESNLRQAFGAGRNVVADVIVSTGKGPRLVAFVTVPKVHQNDKSNMRSQFVFAAPDEDFQNDVVTAESSLRDLMPTYMIPSLYIPLPRMPTTPSGKIDRRLLREAAAALSSDELLSYLAREKKAKLPVSTVAEIQLQSTWAQLFNMSPEHISADDDFFHLNGDSIIAMKMVAMIVGVGRQVTVADVFQHSKLSDLAMILESRALKDLRNGQQQSGERSRAYQQECVELLNNLPLRNDWFKRHIITDIFAATTSQSVLLSQCSIAHFRFSLRGALDPDRLRNACAAMVSRHSMLRTVFIKDKERFFQVVLESMEDAFHHIKRQDEDIESFCKDLFANESEAAPFDTPPVGFTLVSASEKEHIFIVRINHAQYDGISFPILIRDLAAAYRGDLHSLPPAVQFSTYVDERSLPETHPAFDFWREYLKDSKMTALNSDYMKMDLKMDPDPVVRSKTDTSIPAPPAGMTLATLVKAAWSYVLSQFKRETDVVFGQTVAGRGLPIPGVDEIQGLCLSFIPFRTTVHPESTVLEFLTQVQNQHIESTRYEYLDFQDIIQNSTTWHTDTKFGSILQHQNKEGALELLLDDDKSIIECWKHSADVDFLPLSETWVFSFQMLASKRLHLFMLTRKEIMDQKMADGLIEKLRETVEAFSSFPDQRIFTFEGESE